MSFKKSLLVVAVLFAAGSSSQAQAQFFGGYNNGFYGGLPYSVYVLDALPYYALHPPVYYSHIVPRPYGYSPYAYPPGIMTPDRPSYVPALIDNPYASSPATPDNPVTPSNTEDRVALAEPKTIINPYVSGAVAGTPLPTPRRGKPAPKTVRPTELARTSGKLAG